MKQRDPLLYGVVGVFIGGAVVWFLAASSVNTNNLGMMQMMGMRGGYQNMMGNTSAIDAHFIEQMIPHHEDAITMAKLAQTNAARSEVKQLAQNIITSQSKEIEQMRKWYRDWYGKDAPEDEIVMGMHGMQQRGNMHMGMMGDETDLTLLETATDFDRAFVEEMIPHHQMAVMMAQMLKNSTQRSEMENLVDDIVRVQTAEIDQMRDWLRSW